MNRGMAIIAKFSRYLNRTCHAIQVELAFAFLSSNPTKVEQLKARNAPSLTRSLHLRLQNVEICCRRIVIFFLQENETQKVSTIAISNSKGKTTVDCSSRQRELGPWNFCERSVVVIGQ